MTGVSIDAGPFHAWQPVLPPKPIQVKARDAVAAAAAGGPAGGSGGSGSQFPPATPIQTPPYSALRTPKTPRTPAVGKFCFCKLWFIVCLLTGVGGIVPPNLRPEIPSQWSSVTFLQ